MSLKNKTYHCYYTQIMKMCYPEDKIVKKESNTLLLVKDERFGCDGVLSLASGRSLLVHCQGPGVLLATRGH
jgi:hypothetical protein